MICDEDVENAVFVGWGVVMSFVIPTNIKTSTVWDIKASIICEEDVDGTDAKLVVRDLMSLCFEVASASSFWNDVTISKACDGVISSFSEDDIGIVGNMAVFKALDEVISSSVWDLVLLTICDDVTTFDA